MEELTVAPTLGPLNNGMTMRTRLFPLSLAILTSQLLNAQVQDWINAEPDELRALARRTLVVEIPEENPKEIDRFNKKTAEERTADYRATLESYRQVIEPAVRATWTFNEEIEFRTTSEILELFKQKSTKHVALMKAVLLNGGPVAANSPATVVPAFVLTRTDGKRHKANPQGVFFFADHDFQSYLVPSRVEGDAEYYSEASMKLSLMLCQEYLDWNIKSKKTDTFMKFLKDKAQENCSKVKGRELVVDQDGLHNSTTQEALVEAFGGPITFMPREQMEQAFLAGGSEKAVLFPVPVGAINNAQGINAGRYVYSKVVVDPATGNVLNAVVPTTGKSFLEELIPKDLEGLKGCR